MTAGVAAPAYAGIPVTHRDTASAVAFVTGHEDPDKPESALDWEALARFPGTLVLYMGVKNLPPIAERLIAAGRPADEPAAVVERGTLPGQRTVIAHAGRHRRAGGRGAGIKAPAITVIGGAAGLRETLAWLERRPLHGRSVAVTRARAQASGLAARLRALGAEVVETPAIRIEPRPVAGEIDRGRADRRVRAGVRDQPQRRGAADGRAWPSAGATRVRWPAPPSPPSGRAPRRELARRGIRADVVPPRSIAESLVEALESVPVEGKRVLVARAAEARDVLPDALRERGARGGRPGAVRHGRRAARTTPSSRRSAAPTT